MKRQKHFNKSRKDPFYGSDDFVKPKRQPVKKKEKQKKKSDFYDEWEEYKDLDIRGLGDDYDWNEYHLYPTSAIQESH